MGVSPNDSQDNLTQSAPRSIPTVKACMITIFRQHVKHFEEKEVYFNIFDSPQIVFVPAITSLVSVFLYNPGI